MIRYLNHIAIAVPNLDDAIKLYRDVFGLNVGEPTVLEEHGVKVVVVNLPNIKIELMEPFGKNSPLSGFLDKNKAGGLHHISFEVDNIINTKTLLNEDGNLSPIGDGTPKIGFHKTPTLFYHPRDCGGVLVEFEEKGVVSQDPISPVHTEKSKTKYSDNYKDPFQHDPSARIKIRLDD